MNPRDALERKLREHLDAHTLAVQNLTLSHIAIGILEAMQGSRHAVRAIRILKLGQVRELKGLDSSAGSSGLRVGLVGEQHESS